MRLVHLKLIDLRSVCQNQNRVPGLLGSHPAKHGPGEQVAVDISDGWRRIGLCLIGLGVENDPLKLTQVKLEIHHHFREISQQFRVGARLEIVKVVDWFVHGDSEHLLPESIGDVGRETRIFVVSHPSRERIAQRMGVLEVHLIGGKLTVGLAPGNQARRDLRSRLHIIVCVVLRVDHCICPRVLDPVHARREDGCAILFGQIGVGLDAISNFARIPMTHIGRTEKRRHFIELPLGPVSERVVVALGATHVGTEESGQGVRQAVQRHARITQQISGRTVCRRAAIGGEHGENRLVPRTVCPNTILQPPLIETILGALDSRLETEHIGMPIKLMRHVTLAHEQLINEIGAFFLIGILHKALGFGRTRNSSDCIKVDPAHENAIAGWSISLQTSSREFCSNLLVDTRSPLLDLLPAQSEVTITLNRRRIFDRGKRSQLQWLELLLDRLTRNVPSLGLSLGLPHFLLRQLFRREELGRGQSN